MDIPHWLKFDKVKGLLGLTDNSRQRIAAIGMFDGVHRGHMALIRFLIDQGAARGLAPTAVTFADHPLRIVAPERAPKLLSSVDLKIAQLKEAGIEDCVLLDFDEKLRHKSAKEFMSRLMRDYSVKTLVVGFNHIVGHDRVADIDAYRRIGNEIGLEILEAPEFRDGSRPISSSTVRRNIDEGDLETANRLLGHPFTIAGTVVEGNKLGRTLGFPTANVEPTDPNQQYPTPGVYAATVRTPDGATHRAMVNVGYRPTITRTDAPESQNVLKLSIEANLFDFLGYLYGENVEVSFLKFIRKEKKFATIDKLKAAIADDEAKIRHLFEKK